MLNRQKREYRIEVVGHEYVLERWDEIDSILYRVFEDSEFNDNFTRTRPAEHTWKTITEPYQEGLVHIIALDADNNILGALFVVPSCNPQGKEDCEIGWTFTIELYSRFRHEIMDAIFKQAHIVAKRAGFSRIITEMGTKVGTKFLCKNHDYIHTPIPDKNNRYIKELD